MGITSKLGNRKNRAITKTKRGIARLKAENQNLKLYKDFNLPVHIFRLPGIYGPDRSIVDKIKRNRFVIKKIIIFQEFMLMISHQQSIKV